MKKRIMTVVLAGAVLAGCSEDFMSEEGLQPEVPTVRLAVDNAETRASLDGVSVSWEAGDEISVNGTTYTLEGSESEGWYVDVAEAASYEAVYPASAVRSDGLLVLPAVQHYTAGSFDASAHLMTASAQSADEGLQFRNQCALLKLALTGTATVERIVLTGNNDEYLAGPGEKNDETGMALRIADDYASIEAVRWMRLDFGEGAALASEPLVCYLVVPVQEFAKGFSLEIHTSDGMMMEQSTASAQRFVRSGILSMPAFEVKGTMRVLTFEDEDYRGGTNFVGRTDWSSLIDNPQYGGSLLYGSSGYGPSDYYWHDDGNTFLYHSFPESYGTTCYWGGGHGISNYVEMNMSNGDFNHQLAVYYKDPVTGYGGRNGSQNFCVHYGYKDDSGYTDAMILPSIYFSDGKARVVDHMYVMWNTYLANCIFNGNSLTEPVGPDGYVRVMATGYDENGDKIEGIQPEFYFAGQDANITGWSKWDLSGLGAVTKIEFNMGGDSDNGYGFSQPAYFCYDDVAVRFE